MPSLVKGKRIKGLEDLLIELALDPNDINVSEEITRNKNVDIQTQ